MSGLFHLLFTPFVSSEVETRLDCAPCLMGISTSLDANGEGRAV
ncbi:hypothetical protein [Sphingopyxis sp. MWB1]|nr:hypothetical protein [Sphingopyxis sp. MWB1]